MHLDLEADRILLAGALLLVGGLIASRLASRLRVPGMLLFLLAGMVIGDDGLGWLRLSNAPFAQTLAVVALVLILFDGGLANPASDVRRVLAPVSLLATVGVAITAAMVGIVATHLFGLSLTEGMLLGAVVASTDAAAVFSVLDGVPITRRLAALLETESGANDPMAALLTIGFVAMSQGHVTALDWAVFGVRQLVGGLAVGWLLGRLAGRAVNGRDWLDGSVVPLVGLATAAGAFGLSATFGASGLLAVYVSAIVLTAHAPAYQRPLKAFFGSIAEVCQLGLFFLLGVLVFPSQLGAVAWRSIALAAALIFIALSGGSCGLSPVVPLQAGRARVRLARRAPRRGADRSGDHPPHRRQRPRQPDLRRDVLRGAALCRSAGRGDPSRNQVARPDRTEARVGPDRCGRADRQSRHARRGDAPRRVLAVGRGDAA